MLTTITVNNFAIIDNLELDFKPGMTTLTGETGAGKSIIIDALQYALGARADSSMVRHGCKRADISVNFTITTIPNALTWLQQHVFDDETSCLLRRTINADGGSKQFINGQPCTQTQMRELATLLITIHGQQDNQLLTKMTKQQQLLDDFAQSMGLKNHSNQAKALDTFAKHQQVVAEVRSTFQTWSSIKTEIDALQNNSQDYSARIELLRYQIQELVDLALQPDETTTLEKEFKILTQADDLSADCNAVNDLLSSETDQNILSMLQTAIAKLTKYQQLDPHIANSVTMLDQALIQADEAHLELSNYLANIDIAPERVQQVEARLQHIHDLARKHKMQPEQLSVQLHTLQTTLAELENADQRVATLQAELHTVEQRYQAAAKKLTASRQQAATTFNQQVSENIQQLGMPGGQFRVNLISREHFSSLGNEQVEFLVSANPGQPLKPINKVASGGELSRISLAIEVITAQNTNTPTLIFDEVDTGIGGGTAEIVGKLLRQLGCKTQVLCITHLAQVAAQAHHHLQVSKSSDGKQTETHIKALTAEQKIQEIARMLGGMKITKQTLAHATEMLTDV